ncbi:MAG: AI-2E family transporter [Lachnospiraceae bacterium]|nr:AI-2E family transporter [Lachnospiraceae bacterium]
MKDRGNKVREWFPLIIITGLVALAVLRFDSLLAIISQGLVMVKPFLIGASLAFVINLPMEYIEDKLLVKLPQKLEKSKRTLSIILSLVFFSAIIAFVVMTVIPQMARTLTSLGQKIPVFFDNLLVQAEILLEDNPQALEYIKSLEYNRINWDSVIDKTVQFLKNGVGSLLASTVNVAGNVLGGLVNGVIAFIFSIYILTQKEKLKDQLGRILKAYVKEKKRERMKYIALLLYRNFSRFLTGQCIEAVILGVLFIVVMTISGMPYAFMIGVLIGFTALIPIVGAFIGCFVGAFMILVEDPVRAIAFLIMFLIIQQIEGNLIYPKVVGNSVGLPSLWVLLAVTLGSSMFGVIGMLVFIPLFSTGYTLLKEDVNKKNNEGGK